MSLLYDLLGEYFFTLDKILMFILMYILFTWSHAQYNIMLINLLLVLEACNL